MNFCISNIDKVHLCDRLTRGSGQHYYLSFRKILARKLAVPTFIWEVFLLGAETDNAKLPPSRQDSQLAFPPTNRELHFGFMNRDGTKQQELTLAKKSAFMERLGTKDKGKARTKPYRKNSEGHSVTTTGTDSSCKTSKVSPRKNTKSKTQAHKVPSKTVTKQDALDQV